LVPRRPLPSPPSFPTRRSSDLRFSLDFSGDLSATVESVTDGEDGRAVAVFSSQEGLARTTLLRMQTVELIFDSRTGLRVPKQAVDRKSTRLNSSHVSISYAVFC